MFVGKPSAKATRTGLFRYTGGSDVHVPAKCAAGRKKAVPLEKTVPLGLWGKAHDSFEKGLSSHFWVFCVRNKGCYCDDISVFLLIITAPVAKKRCI